ncbi:MAG: hypothetical protein HOP10_11150 [Chitinophagaceae bacterium]|nr:hypothetical protein [Chitinophagaceae bacterium]
MLSAKEKRFLKYWDDQKTGGKWSYILVYTIGWGFLIFFVPMIISYMSYMYASVHLYVLLGLSIVPIWILIVFSLAVGCVISFFQWDRNEGKYRKIRYKESSKPAQ